MANSLLARSILIWLGCFPAVVASVNSQTVATEPFGFVTTACLSNSDTYVSAPFTRPPEVSGTVATASSSTVTVTGTPGWVTDQFAYVAGTQPKSYYLLIGNGGSTNPKEGHIYFVTGNTPTSLTVDTAVDSLTGVTAGTGFAVIPYWTPATLFPNPDLNISFTPTTSTSSFRTQIRVPSVTVAGTELPYSAIYYYSDNVDNTSSNSGWRKVGDAITRSYDDEPLSPDGYLVIRNQNDGGGTPARTLNMAGTVLLKSVAVPLATSTTQDQDNPIAFIRAVDVPLNATGLNQIEKSMLPGDRLLLFDNAVAGFDKLPHAAYYFAAGWRLAGDPITDRGNDVVPAGAAVLVRKAPTSTAQTLTFLNSPTYVDSLPLTPLQAVSRRPHSTPGNFDINLPLNGIPGVESRSGGSYSIVLNFARAVSCGTPSLNSGAVYSGISVSGDGTTAITVNLTGVATAQHLTITLPSVNDGTTANDVAIPMDVLIGDVNGSGFVDSADVGSIQRQSGKPISAANFRLDVNGSGFIDSADVGLVQRQNGKHL